MIRPRLLRTGTSRPGAVRGAVRWAVAALVLWLVAAACDRTTEVSIFSDGGRLQVTAAGSTLTAPVAVLDVRAVEIRAVDSIDPPGGLGITVTSDTDVVLDEALPRTFRWQRKGITPVGDWEIDAGAARGTVWRREMPYSGPFELAAGFRGRFLEDLEIVLEGRPGARIAVRRGLINNDLFIRDADGRDLAATSIDPTPLADLAAVVAIASRAAALGAVLIAAFCLLAARTRSRPLPAAVSPSPFVLLAVVLAVAAASLSAWVALSVLDGLPHTPDEVVYLLQARWLLDGRLWGEPGALGELLTVPYTYVKDLRWLAHYPQGWPLLLAAGAAAGLPALAAPVLGGVLVLLLYLCGRELDGPTTGLLAAALAVVSPLLRVLSGTMLSHTAAATLLLGALVLTIRAGREGGGARAMAAGCLIGLAVGVRPLTAFAFALPLTAALIGGAFDRRLGRFGRRPLTAFLAGALVGSLPILAANKVVTGSAFTFPYTLARGSMLNLDAIPFGLRNLDALLASDGAGLFGWGWPLVHGAWAVAAAFAVAWVPFLLGRARASDFVLAALALCTMVAYLGTRGHGLHGFGARYHFEALLPIILLSSRGLHELARIGSDDRGSEKPAVALAAIGLFFAVGLPAGAILPQRMALYRDYNRIDGSLESAIKELRPRRAVVVLPPDEWQGWAMAAQYITADPGAPILIVQAEATDPRIFAAAGDRPVFAWRERTLVPLTRPPPAGNNDRSR